MPVSPDELRDALRRLAAGVTVVTASVDGRRRGMTASSFAAVSIDPPLVSVAIDARHAIHPLLASPGVVFAVNVLAEDQAALSQRFAFVEDEDRFAEGAWRTAVTGAPVLADALAWLDCRPWTSFAAGTHTIHVGEVQAVAVPRPEARPLVYWDRAYRRLKADGGD